MDYNFKKIEKKWQKKWEEKKIFSTQGVPPKDGKVKEIKKKKYYVLEMFPYPSASGLHMGHALNYTIGDVFARFKRMNGFNVLYPMGFDALGLPAENAAIEAKEHPKPFTKNAIKNYIRQMKELGLSYDWSRIVSTMEPEYYKWNQYFFLKMFEKKLVYRKKAPVNFCKKCDTVLANEQVHNGKCWRHENTEVEIKQLEQWFIKTTAYVDELLDKIEGLQWPERVKSMQKNWIGKSEGTEIIFDINNEKWKIFTTRPDTIYGVTFMVVSAQHEKLMELITKEQKKEVEKFLKKIKTTKQENIDKLDKEGVFTGSYAINPINNEKIPVYVGNFVVADYGSGMVMGVPAHDQRDFDFAKKYNLKIKPVIVPETVSVEDFKKGPSTVEKKIIKIKGQEKALKKILEDISGGKTCYVGGEGILINSDKFNGLNSREAKEHITKFLKSENLGKKTIQYKLRDWLISRQRYWGTPIPFVYCDKCGIVPIPEKNLPVLLPEKVKFGKGNPLKTNKNFLETKCPKCKTKAKRETDTMDTFFDSSWYYLRYCDNKNNKEAFDKKKVKYWMPVDQYIGGVEHACMHLIYARFFTKMLRDFGFVNFDEPFTRLFNQGMLHGSDGEKMSKSKGNVVNPDEVSKKYGMDTARFFLLSLAAPDKPRDWSEKGIEGSLKFIKKIMNYFDSVKIGKADAKTESKLNKSIKEVTRQIERFNYNLSVIKIRELFNSLPKETSKDVLKKSLILLSPFCPHIAEELWEKLGNKNFISLEKWPKYDEKKIDENLEKQEQLVEKLISDINHVVKLVNEKQNTEIKKVFVYVLPNEKEMFEDEKEIIKKKINIDIQIYAVNEKDKYDPENKSKKVKPGRPGIYLE
jgi:leucyl-tRNA synthetase|tara:strand:- start:1176 stop:3761 length:2586 start_codon:yes stop_codon:yes gene_type:complete